MTTAGAAAGRAAGDATVLPFGDRGALREVATLDEAIALHAAAVAAPPPEVVDLVPAARTLLAITRPGGSAAAARWLATLAVEPQPWAPTVEHRIPVAYDGPGLAETARLAGVRVDELVDWHSGARWRAAFCGFAPGFAYLVPADAAPLDIPRLDAPRASVPAGSVALAAGYSAVYPGASPGGWRCIGSALVDVRDRPIAPGDAVRFERRDAGSAP